jgi:hypothetical protein
MPISATARHYLTAPSRAAFASPTAIAPGTCGMVDAAAMHDARKRWWAITLHHLPLLECQALAMKTLDRWPSPARAMRSG